MRPTHQNNGAFFARFQRASARPSGVHYARRLQVATNGPYRGHRAGDMLSRLDRGTPRLPSPGSTTPYASLPQTWSAWGKGKAVGPSQHPAALLCRSTLREYTAVVGPMVHPFPSGSTALTMKILSSALQHRSGRRGKAAGLNRQQGAGGFAVSAVTA